MADPRKALAQANNRYRRRAPFREAGPAETSDVKAGRSCPRTRGGREGAVRLALQVRLQRVQPAARVRIQHDRIRLLAVDEPTEARTRTGGSVFWCTAGA